MKLFLSFKTRLIWLFRSVLLAALILLFGAGSALAVPLAQYRSNLQQARLELQGLQEIDAGEAADLKVSFSRVRSLIPRLQKVELADGASIEADNKWFEASLAEIDASVSAEQKFEKLTAVVERLSAIENRLLELEKAQAAARSKNDDKQALNEILRRPEYQRSDPQAEKSVLDRWLEAIDEWFRNFFKWLFGNREPIGAEQPQVNAGQLGTFLKYLVIALSIAVIGFVVWRFVLPLFGGDKRRPRKKKEPRVILGETLAPDETAEDLLSQAERLARSGDVRAAIRKGYIALLCELSDRQLLGLARHKTNRDYLRDVGKQPQILQPMRALTNSFERHWYGSVPANEDDWQEFRKQLTVISQQ